MARMELQNTVKEAVNAQYHHLDDACRMQADRCLQEFQRTIDAWQIIGKALVLDEIINYAQSLQQHSQMMLDAHAVSEIATAAAGGPQTELLHIRRRF